MPEAKSSAPSAPTFSAQQVADAKSKVCSAYEKMHRARDINATRNGGDDPNTQLLVAVNMRQVFVAGSAHLLTTLAQEPATPRDLAESAQKLADLSQTITLDGLVSDASASAQNAFNATGQTIQSLCK
jgi:hypothetical protein